MKMIWIFIIFLSACDSSSSSSPTSPKDTLAEKKQEKIMPGVVVLSDSEKIPDPLNELYFTIKLVTNEYSHQGSYTLFVNYGHNKAENRISYPRGSVGKITPAMKKLKTAYSYDIGFYFHGDTSFYSYYLVQAPGGNIEMKYIKAYSFE